MTAQDWEDRDAGASLFDLTDRVALVTGGNGGIGLSIAKALGKAGAQVAILGRNQRKEDTAVAELARIPSRFHGQMQECWRG